MPRTNKKTDDLRRHEKLVQLSEQAQEVVDLLKALDLIGDGIGGEKGFAISAVALQGKMIASDLLHSLEVMADRQPPAHVHTPAPDVREGEG